MFCLIASSVWFVYLYCCNSWLLCVVGIANFGLGFDMVQLWLPDWFVGLACLIVFGC